MASAIYPKFKEALLKGDIDLDTADLRIALVSSGYTFNTAHEFHDDLTNILATSASFNASSLTDGTLDFADVTISGLDTGETAAAYVLVVWTGTSGTSNLVAFKDDAAELPLAGATGIDVVLAVNVAGFLTL
jgi:hypothetical protein